MNDKNLLSSDEEEDVDNRISVNRKFAQSFESKKRAQELKRSKATLLEEDEDDEEIDSEDDESEDEDGEALSAALDLQIIKTINSLKQKDPKIYDSQTKWFDDAKDAEDNEEISVDISSNKRKTYKDVIREQLLEHGADIEEGDSGRKEDRKKLTLLYDEEQAALRSEFLEAVASASGDDGNDVIQLRKKSTSEVAREEAELREALAEMQSLEANKSEADAFLLDYMARKKWKDENVLQVFDAVDDDYEQEEDELDRLDAFESKYNFRFEELAAGMGSNTVQIAGHARSVEDSLRRADVTRQKQREARKERKEKERRQKEAELRRLKNLKRQELQERLRKIGEVGGVGNDLCLDEAALEEDWDPEKHEAIMESQFGDEYYAAGAADEFDLEGGGEDYDVEEDAGALEDRMRLRGEMAALDELDYEDLIGGLECRFRYRSVEAESFGLSTEEILRAEDNELNQLVSLKKIAAYRSPGGRDIGLNAKSLAKKRRRLRLALKERVESSEARRESAVDAEPPVESEGKTKRRRRRKQTSEAVSEAEAEGEGEVGVESGATEGAAHVPVPMSKPQKTGSRNSSKTNQQSKPKKTDAKSKKKQRMMLYS